MAVQNRPIQNPSVRGDEMEKLVSGYTVPVDSFIEDMSHGSLVAFVERLEKAKLVSQLNRLDHICSFEVDREDGVRAIDHTSGSMFYITVSDAQEHLEFLLWLRDEEEG